MCGHTNQKQGIQRKPGMIGQHTGLTPLRPRLSYVLINNATYAGVQLARITVTAWSATALRRKEKMDYPANTRFGEARYGVSAVTPRPTHLK